MLPTHIRKITNALCFKKFIVYLEANVQQSTLKLFAKNRIEGALCFCVLAILSLLIKVCVV
jgi:hypothetical protein